MLSPMMQCGSTIRVKNCPFGAPDGATSTFQLADRHGHAVTKDVRLQSIHQTDWQGRVELSGAPRTSLAANSGNPMNWNAGGTTKTAYNDYVLGNNTFHSARVASGGGTFNGSYTTFAAAAGKTYILSWLLSAGTSGLAQLVAWSTGNGTSLLNGTVGALSAAGQSAGALSIIDQIEVDTDVWLVRAEFACAYDDAAMRLMAGPWTATEVDDVIVLGGWAEQADKPGAYIPTTNSPVTVTDYTHDGAGGITTGQVPVSGATLDWTGTARRAA